MSVENNTKSKVSMVDRLRQALRGAQTGHGSYSPNYNSATLAANIEQIISELEDANTPPSNLDLSKYHAWLQSVSKARTLAQNADHDMPDEKRAFDRMVSFFSSFSKSAGYPSLSESERAQWLPVIKAGSELCYENGHRGDSSTLAVEIYDFIKSYRNPVNNPEIVGLCDDNSAYLNCLGKARDLGYQNVAEALANTPSRFG
jgi:hypothetical protein